MKQALYKGPDISKHNGNIDWNAVKNSGVQYVIQGMVKITLMRSMSAMRLHA